ncbi:MAG: N-6 DNA methylase, partial [Promethearchaeota archaeon]
MPKQKFITKFREILVMNWKQWHHPPDLVLGEHHINFLISSLFLQKFPLYLNIQQKIQEDLRNALWSIWAPSKEYHQETKSSKIFFDWCSVLESDRTVVTLVDKLLVLPKSFYTTTEAPAIFSDHSAVVSDLLHDTWLRSFLHLSQLFQDLRYSSKKSAQKAMGSYYTPPKIILYMLSRLRSDINSTGVKRPEPIRIVDYACGMGAFLFYAAAFLSPKVHAVSFWGLDSDPFAIQAAQICKLFLSSHPKFGTTFTSIHFLQKDSLTPLTTKDILCLENDKN